LPIKKGSQARLPSFIPGVRNVIAKRSKDVIKKLLDDKADLVPQVTQTQWVTALQEHANGQYLASIKAFKVCEKKPKQTNSETMIKFMIFTFSIGYERWMECKMLLQPSNQLPITRSI
jgi:hypothetical protein